jgi:hypothetical protein
VTTCLTLLGLRRARIAPNILPRPVPRLGVIDVGGVLRMTHADQFGEYLHPSGLVVELPGVPLGQTMEVEMSNI